MRRYFFHYRAEPADTIGIDFPDDRTARLEGLRAFGQMLEDMADEGADSDIDRSMIVTDSKGRTLLHIGLLTTPSDHNDPDDKDTE